MELFSSIHFLPFFFQFIGLLNLAAFEPFGLRPAARAGGLGENAKQGLSFSPAAKGGRSELLPVLKFFRKGTDNIADKCCVRQMSW
jgi:hypothetical protein